METINSQAKIEAHPYAEFFPLNGQDESVRDIVEDMRHNGYDPMFPVVLYADPGQTKHRVLDGRRRLVACKEAKVDALAVVYEGDAPAAFVARANINRRNLSVVARLAVTERIRPLIAAEAKGRMKAGKKNGDAANRNGNAVNPGQNSVQGRVNEQIADIAGVSKETVRLFHNIEEHGSEAIKQAVQEEKVSISDAAAIVDLPRREQSALLAEVNRGEAKTLREAAGRSKPKDRTPKGKGDAWEGGNDKPDKVKDSDLVTDQLGTALPKWLQHKFGSELLPDFIKAMQSWAKMLTTPAWSGFFKQGEVPQVLRDFADRAKSAIPYALCPACEGKNRAKDCKACKEHGYMTRSQYETWRQSGASHLPYHKD